MIKSLKILTINDNTAKNYFLELLQNIEAIDDNINTMKITFIFISSLNITTCLYIFIGRNYYPSWIIKLNIQDESYIDIYLASLYFVIVTITTVGYGDITGSTIPEIILQIILLILGTIAYSFIISYFSNYIVKKNQKSIYYENKVNILKEIRYHHPNMDDALYNEVLRNLHNEEYYEKKDKQLLFQCLPYSLKNKLIMEMYKPIIKHFEFFKGVNNADFIIKVATSLKPLISVKGDTLIHIGDFIKEIFFIKKGVIEICISIDLNDLKNSIQNNFALINSEKINENTQSVFAKQKEKKKTVLDTETDLFLLSKMDNSNYNDNNNIDISQMEDIIISEMKAKRHFGESLMFLNRPSPYKVRIGTRNAELLILRKMEAIEIYTVYPNIWKRINKKSLYNMEQINFKAEKKLIEISKKNHIKLAKKYLIYQNIIIKNDKHNNSFGNNNKNESPRKRHKNKEREEKDENKEKKDITKINESKLLESKNNSISRNITTNSAEDNHSIKQEKNKSKTSLSLMDMFNNPNPKKNLFENTFISLSKNDNIKNSENNYSLKSTAIIKSIYEKNSLIQKDLKGLFEDKKSNKKNQKSNNGRFMNLKLVNESSIQLNSSYENINKISNYRYINNLNLQKRAKLYIINESKKKIIYQNSLRVPSTMKLFNEEDSNKKYLSTNKKNDTILNKAHNSYNKSKATKGSGLFDCKGNYGSDIAATQNFQSKRLNKQYYNSPKENINTFTQSKNKKKLTNEKALIGKRLNAISKNIQNAKEAISNPNEFYVNLFNDIIQRESTFNISHDDEKEKVNQINKNFLRNHSLAIKADKRLSNKSGKIESKLTRKKNNQ
jgi:hypothetical protein